MLKGWSRERKFAVFLFVLGLISGASAVYLGYGIVADTFLTETTTGVVTESAVEERTGGSASRADDPYSVVIEYRYTVDGKSYTSDSVFQGQTAAQIGYQRAHELSQQYSVGTEVTVHYRPWNPSRAYLVGRVPLSQFVPVVITTVFAVVGLGVGYKLYLYELEHEDSATADTGAIGATVTTQGTTTETADATRQGEEGTEAPLWERVLKAALLSPLIGFITVSLIGAALTPWGGIDGSTGFKILPVVTVGAFAYLMLRDG